MFRRVIWCFAVLCVVECRKSIISNRKSSMEKEINIPVFEKQRLINNLFAVKGRETRTKEVKIIKRGIVLVDEDFDVPSAIYAHENNTGADESKTDKLDRNEGSGNDEFDGKELNKADDVPHEIELNKATNDLPDEKEVSKATKDALDEKEKATNGVFDEKELNKSTKDDTHQQSDDYSIPTKPTNEKAKVTKDISLLTDAGSSGDDIQDNNKEYFITEAGTKSHTEIQYELHDILPDICINSTCSQDDLFISLSDDNKLIAEGTNLTLSCKCNDSNHSMLYWYKSNGTMYFLQAFGTKDELFFNIPDTKPVHSGIYKCVKWANRQTCCNMKVHLSIYEIPLYKYHLLILGLIALACLLICIILSVRQTTRLKTYTKQFVQKHGRVKQQLL